MNSDALLPILLTLLLSAGAAGCDFLEPEPKTFVDSSNYYQTPEEIENGVIGIYARLQNLYSSDNYFWAMTEMRSDNTTVQWEPFKLNDIEYIDEFQSQVSNPIYEEIWSIAYSGIQQANIVLNRIESVEFANQQEKEEFVGESKFLRALFYFHLVRLWGDVPRIVDELSAEQAFTDSRSPEEEIYNQIIADATDAAGVLPPDRPNAEAGRATEGAALTLLGTVHLTLEDYQQAIEAFQKVTTLDYGLVPEYANVYDPDNKNHEESIFAVQYEAGLASGEEASSWIYRFAPSNSGSDIIGYTDLDAGNSGFNIPTVDMLEAYEEGDERFEASIAFYKNPENSEYDNVAIGDSIPFINKFNHDFPQEGQTRENWPVFRYAHVLLMYAEALNEAGRTAEAYPHLNVVRERAGLPPLSNLSAEEFREAVYREQRVELAFENHRWYNLKRTDRALEVMRRHGEGMIERGSRITEGFYNIEEYKLLYPIPFREVRLNNFQQNPGW